MRIVATVLLTFMLSACGGHVTGQIQEYRDTRAGVASSGVLEFPSGAAGSPVATVELRNESAQGVQFTVAADAPILVGVYLKSSNVLALGEPDSGISRKGLTVRLGPNERRKFSRTIPAGRLATLPAGEYRIVASVTTVGGESLMVDLGPLFLPLGGPR